MGYSEMYHFYIHDTHFCMSSVITRSLKRKDKYFTENLFAEPYLILTRAFTQNVKLNER